MNDFTKGEGSFDMRGNYMHPKSSYYTINNGNTIEDWESWGFTKHDAHLIATAGTTATEIAEAGYDAVKLLEVLPQLVYSIEIRDWYHIPMLLDKCRGDV